mmetsp:Transcript_31142/g.96234  ORF Transcript_31142/g.96234 Transcript_31142/m.96234 type:complete len:288 (-) Transcript_31142:431-1294(-)
MITAAAIAPRTAPPTRAATRPALLMWTVSSWASATEFARSPQATSSGCEASTPSGSVHVSVLFTTLHAPLLSFWPLTTMPLTSMRLTTSKKRMENRAPPVGTGASVGRCALGLVADTEMTPPCRFAAHCTSRRYARVASAAVGALSAESTKRWPAARPLASRRHSRLMPLARVSFTVSAGVVCCGMTVPAATRTGIWSLYTADERTCFAGPTMTAASVHAGRRRYHTPAGTYVVTDVASSSTTGATSIESPRKKLYVSWYAAASVGKFIVGWRIAGPPVRWLSISSV